MPWITEQVFKPCCEGIEGILSKGLLYHRIRINHEGIAIYNDNGLFTTLPYCPFCGNKTKIEINERLIESLRQAYDIIDINHYVYDTKTEDQQHLINKNLSDEYSTKEYSTKDIIELFEKLKRDGYEFEELQNTSLSTVRIFMCKEV